jgi:hypothetical protein
VFSTRKITEEDIHTNEMPISLQFPMNTFVIRLWMGISEADGRWYGRIDHLQSQKYEIFNNLMELFIFIRTIVEHPEGDPEGKYPSDG